MASGRWIDAPTPKAWRPEIPLEIPHDVPLPQAAPPREAALGPISGNVALFLRKAQGLRRICDHMLHRRRKRTGRFCAAGRVRRRLTGAVTGATARRTGPPAHMGTRLRRALTACDSGYQRGRGTACIVTRGGQPPDAQPIPPQAPTGMPYRRDADPHRHATVRRTTPTEPGEGEGEADESFRTVTNEVLWCFYVHRIVACRAAPWASRLVGSRGIKRQVRCEHRPSGLRMVSG